MDRNSLKISRLSEGIIGVSGRKKFMDLLSFQNWCLLWWPHKEKGFVLLIVVRKNNWQQTVQIGAFKMIAIGKYSNKEALFIDDEYEASSTKLRFYCSWHSKELIDLWNEAAAIFNHQSNTNSQIKRNFFFKLFKIVVQNFAAPRMITFFYFLLKLAGKSNYKLVEKIMQENWKSSCCMIWKLLALMIKSRIRKWEIRVKNSYCENLLGPLSDHHYWFRKINVKNKVTYLTDEHSTIFFFFSLSQHVNSQVSDASIFAIAWAFWFAVVTTLHNT